MCSAILQPGGSNTKSLISQLKSKHKIDVKTSFSEGIAVEDDKPKTKLPRIEAYFNKKELIGEVIARLVSVNGLNINQIANSLLIKRVFKSDDYSLPKSSHTICDHFIKEF